MELEKQKREIAHLDEVKKLNQKHDDEMQKMRQRIEEQDKRHEREKDDW